MKTTDPTPEPMHPFGPKVPQVPSTPPLPPEKPVNYDKTVWQKSDGTFETRQK